MVERRDSIPVYYKINGLNPFSRSGIIILLLFKLTLANDYYQLANAVDSRPGSVFNNHS